MRRFISANCLCFIFYFLLFQTLSKKNGPIPWVRLSMAPFIVYIYIYVIVLLETDKYYHFVFHLDIYVICSMYIYISFLFNHLILIYLNSFYWSKPFSFFLYLFFFFVIQVITFFKNIILEYFILLWENIFQLELFFLCEVGCLFGVNNFNIT